MQSTPLSEWSALTKLYLRNKDYQVPYKPSGKIWTSLLENTFIFFLQSVFGTTNLPVARQYKVFPLPSIAISFLSGVTSQEGAVGVPGSKKYKNKTIWGKVIVIALLWKQRKDTKKWFIFSWNGPWQEPIHDSSVPGNLQLRLGPHEPQLYFVSFPYLRIRKWLMSLSAPLLRS